MKPTLSLAIVSLALLGVGLPVAMVAKLVGATWLRAVLYGLAGASVVVAADAFAAPRLAPGWQQTGGGCNCNR
jgi:hypothetical protein